MGYPIIYRGFYVPGGAGFLPPTVLQQRFVKKDQRKEEQPFLMSHVIQVKAESKNAWSNELLLRGVDRMLKDGDIIPTKMSNVRQFDMEGIDVMGTVSS